MQFQELLGKTLTKVEVNREKNEIHFFDTCSIEYVMRHFRECCESVSIEDINGDLNDLIGSPILRTIESAGTNHGEKEDYLDIESYTWTFYTLATIKGFVDLRWYGSSREFYSEKVDFYKISSFENQMNFLTLFSDNHSFSYN